MLVLRGLRAFSLSATRDDGGISCDAQGAFVGSVPLLERSHVGGASSTWTVRPFAELNDELTARYGLPIDVAAKAGALTLIANALNRGDLAMAAIATVQMQFPDPSSLVKGVESADETMRRALELHRSHLLKANWDSAKHPRAGAPPNHGWFAPATAAPEAPNVVPVMMDPRHKPWERPEFGGGGGEGGPPELPFPRGLPRVSPPSEPLPTPEAPAKAPSRPPDKVEPQPKLPFPGGLPPRLAPYIPGGKTSGIFQSPDSPDIALQSGHDGPAASMQGSAGFDRMTLSHVEGHAAALMWQQGITEGTLYINNPEICVSCTNLLPRMLPPGSTLRVVLPDGTIKEFRGTGP
jgi:SCP1.201-like deaminase